MRIFFRFFCFLVIALTLSLDLVNPGAVLTASNFKENTSIRTEILTSTDNQTTSNDANGTSYSEGSGGVVADGKMIYGFGRLIDDAGFIYDNLEYVSFDALATLKIPYGTILLTKAGQALRVFTITDAKDPDEPQDGVVLIGAEHDFEPGGATFSPAIPLTIAYRQDTLPDVVTEGTLTIAQWDEATKSYLPIPSTLDPKKHEVTARISHFARYALISVLTPLETSEPETISPQVTENGSLPVINTTTILPLTTPVTPPVVQTSPPLLTPTATVSPTLNPQIVQNLPATGTPARTTAANNFQATSTTTANEQTEIPAASQSEDLSLAFYLSGGCLLATAGIVIILWRRKSKRD